MTLEDKIASLTPELRAQVEDYVDFLVSRSGGLVNFSGFSFSDDSDEEPVESKISSPPEIPVSKPAMNVKGQARSGIIMAEERLPETDPDYIDFADINSRFGHTPKGEEEKKGPGRLKRFLDWM